MKTIVAILLFLTLGTKVAFAQVVEVKPTETEPGHNTEIYPFYDINKDYRLQFEDGERFLPARGVIRWEGGQNTWEAVERPALIVVPNGVWVTADTVAEAENLFVCPQVGWQMPETSGAYAEVPCWSRTPVADLYYLWIGLLRRHQ
jgi:hypothetical protein